MFRYSLNPLLLGTYTSITQMKFALQKLLNSLRIPNAVGIETTGSSFQDTLSQLEAQGTPYAMS